MLREIEVIAIEKGKIATKKGIENSTLAEGNWTDVQRDIVPSPENAGTGSEKGKICYINNYGFLKVCL